MTVLVACFLWSWSVVLAAWLAGVGASGPTGVFVAAGFTVAPYFLSWALGSRPDTTLVLSRWTAGAWLAPIPLAWTVVGIAHVLGMGVIDLSGAGIVERMSAIGQDGESVRAALARGAVAYPVMACVQAALASLVLLGPVSVMEESVWRGVNLTALQRFGRLDVVLSGLLWGIWMLPLVAFSGTPERAWSVAPLGVALALLRRRSGTIWPGAFARGTLYGTVGLGELTLRGGNDAMTSVLGPIGAGVLTLVAAALWFTPPRAVPIGDMPLPKSS